MRLAISSGTGTEVIFPLWCATQTIVSNARATSIIVKLAQTELVPGQVGSFLYACDMCGSHGGGAI